MNAQKRKILQMEIDDTEESLSIVLFIGTGAAGRSTRSALCMLSASYLVIVTCYFSISTKLSGLENEPTKDKLHLCTNLVHIFSLM